MKNRFRQKPLKPILLLLITASFAFVLTSCADITKFLPANDYGEWEIINEATCTENGLKRRYSASDREKYQDSEIPAKGHELIEDEGKTPTCAESGLTARKVCKICSEIISEAVEIPPTGHTPETVPATESTCTVKGKTEGQKCSVCDTVIVAQSELPLAAHTPETIPAVTSTCTAKGKTEGQKCKVCSYVIKAQVETDMKRHTSVTDPAVAPTCTEKGYTEGSHCSVCSYVIQAREEIPEKGHSEQNVPGYPATCTEKGLTDGKICTVCHETLIAQTEIPEKGHTPVGDYGLEPTCTEPGYANKLICDVCKTVLVESSEVPPLGHDEITIPGEPATCTESGLTDGKYCKRCKTMTVDQVEIPKTGHTPVVDAAIPSTCTVKGKTEGSHCSVCKLVLVAQTDAPLAPHTPETLPAVPSTCTVKGKTEGKQCSVCKYVITAQVETDLKPHTPETLPAVPATCTTKGKTEGQKCSVCKYVITAQVETDMLPHTVVVDTAVSPTCTAKGKTEGSHCSVCSLVLVAQTEIPAKGHSPVTDVAVTPTCTEKGKTEGSHCSVCSLVLVAQTEVPAKGHTVVVDPAVAPSATETGLTEGSHCSVCLTVIVKQEVIPKLNVGDPMLYAGDYGYVSLASLSNGAKMQEYYDDILSAALAFHDASDRDADTLVVDDETEYYFLSLNYDSYGLSYEEAVTAWKMFRADNPVFYWVASNIVASSDGSLKLIVSPEYADGDVRTAENASLYAAIAKYVLLAAGETSSYNIALIYHDALIAGADYAYEDDGVTPSDDTDCHSVLGVMTDGEGVCESYAKSLQMLLNYSGVENVFVSGIGGGGPHAWNLVRLDDGKWYWVDVTWDDSPDWQWGVTYYYFCVTDTENVYAVVDGGYSISPAAFITRHAPDNYSGLGMNYSYPLPERSSASYSAGSGELLVKDTFTVDSLTYAVVGANAVDLVSVGKSGSVVVPEKVTYGGRVYTVISVGAMEGKAIVPGNVVGKDCTSLSLPKTVRYIYDNAFRPFVEDGKLVADKLSSLTIDAENPYFTVSGGALYTKDMKELICLIGNTAKTFSVPAGVLKVRDYAFMYAKLETLSLPSGLKEIGNLAFGHNYYLKSVTIPSSVEIMGAYAFTYCGAYVSGSSVITVGLAAAPAGWEPSWNSGAKSTSFAG